jgi:xylulokinase
MAGPYVIGVDLGTQSTKSIIFDADGCLVGEAVAKVELHSPRPGWVEQDPAEFYASTLSTVRQAVANAGLAARDVKAIALDSQMGSVVRIDRSGECLGPLESYMDTRATPQRSRIVAEHGDLLLDMNGILPYIGPKLMWRKEEEPDDYRRTYKAIGLNAYVGLHLAGLQGDSAYTDHSFIGPYGISDIRNYRWSPELADLLGLDLEMMPRIVRPWDVVGELTRTAASECGLAPGTPIVAGTGDAVAGWLGVGAVEAGIAVDTAGSTHHLGFCVDRYVPDLEHKVLIYYPSAIPGLWHPLGYTSGTGRSHSWFVDEFCLTPEQRAAKDREPAYADLEEAAGHIQPGSEGLVFVPHFGGRWCPFQPKVRGACLGLTWKHTKAHVYRAILESIAYEFQSYIKVTRSLHPDVPLKQVVIIGGGARSKLWTQIKADVTGVPHVTCVNRSDFAPLGAAIIAGYAAGVYDDMAAAAKRFTSLSAAVSPRPDYHAAYQPYADFYSRLFDQMATTFEELADLAEMPGLN